ncbi:PqqD family protein [Sphingomicrobium nitratireducens]|uniref:PqqD family protein n=1 Tax=Sphingomicrobium nitratireducens TaxID=2964666 RepID=UPI00223EFC32|nr:PqqD family protein [Sphingomicrobium nitratireducens]
MSAPLLDDTSRIVQRKTLPSGEIDGELLALDVKRGTCLGLDRVGTDIWRLAAQPITLATLIEKLVEDYDATPDEARADVFPFVAELVEAGLLDLVP